MKVCIVCYVYIDENVLKGHQQLNIFLFKTLSAFLKEIDEYKNCNMIILIILTKC